MGAVVAAAGGDVDRDVADEPHAALGGVGAQRAPLALEAHLVVERAVAREGRPVVDPVRARARGRLGDSARRHAASGSASRPGQPAKAEAEA